jgi:hypothetical protein
MFDNMNVKILEPCQYSLWDAFVDISPQGDIFCYSWWIETITKSNFKILVLFENDEIMAGIPLAMDAQNKINEPPLTRTLGVLYRNQKYISRRKQSSTERRWVTELIKHIPLDDFVQMCMHHNFNDWLPFRWNGFSQTTRYTYIIDYRERTISDLWQDLDPLRKRMINKANNNGLKLEITDDFDLLYEKVLSSYERQGLKFKVTYNDFLLLDNAIKSRDKRVIFKAVDNTNRVHAALYVVFIKKSAYYLLSGSDPKLREFGGHTFILWESVKYFIDKVDSFNFGGSDIERIENHFRGFGGKLTPYFHIYNPRLMWKRNDIWFHSHEILFHMKGIFKIMKKKIVKTFRLK